MLWWIKALLPHFKRFLHLGNSIALFRRGYRNLCERRKKQVPFECIVKIISYHGSCCLIICLKPFLLQFALLHWWMYFKNRSAYCVRSMAVVRIEFLTLMTLSTTSVALVHSISTSTFLSQPLLRLFNYFVTIKSNRFVKLAWMSFVYAAVCSVNWSRDTLILEVRY